MRNTMETQNQKLYKILYFYAWKVVWGGPPWVCILKKYCCREFTVVNFPLHILFICRRLHLSVHSKCHRSQYHPQTKQTAIQYWNTCSHQGTISDQYIKTHIVSAEVVFSCRLIIWQTLDKQTFVHIIVVAVGLHPEASHLCYSLLAKHPILHVAPFPFLCFYDSILLPSFEMPFVYYLYRSSWRSPS